MPDQSATCIGRVRHVLGATITVALDADLAGIAPIYRGRLQPIGQVGSLVRLPQGLVDLIASVTLVGIAELAGPVPPVEAVQRDERWLQVELLGEIDRGSGQFRRGVGTYPGLDDPVHFATPDQLRAVFPSPGEGYLRLGRLAAAEDVPVAISAEEFVVRHAAIVGSTGSGKTSAVASIVQNFVRGGWITSNIMIIDPHGEYASALEDSAATLSVLSTGENCLRIPYWALPAADILRILVGESVGGTFSERFSELVAEQRRVFAVDATWLNMTPSAITADTPVPFSLREVWYQLAWENRETREDTADPATVSNGSAEELIAPEFTPHGPGGVPPNKGPFHGVYGTGPERLRLGLLDPRLRFLTEFTECSGEEDPLIPAIRRWLGQNRPVSVLDFGGVPAVATEAAIGVVLNLIFEVAVRSDHSGNGIGRPNPVLVVLEEAHRYLGKEASRLTRDSANRIAREGRKYGVGLLLVSQRPTELPPTALAQCGTMVALRLTNSEDQGAIRSALPDSVTGLASVLPSLRTHEAVVSGDAVVLPARTLIDTPDPWPHAEDPSLDAWRGCNKFLDIGPAVEDWRGIYDHEE